MRGRSTRTALRVRKSILPPLVPLANNVNNLGRGAKTNSLKSFSRVEITQKMSKGYTNCDNEPCNNHQVISGYAHWMFQKGEKFNFLMEYKDIIMNLFELSFSYESPTELNIFDIKVTLSDFLFG